jgi:tetratricopeptide (TPR) repeat protein
VAGIVGLGIALGYQWLGPESIPAGNFPPEVIKPDPPRVEIPPLSIEDRLRVARQAESEGRYADAIFQYREIQKIDHEQLQLTATERQKVKYFLAFCLLMDHRIQEANNLFAEVPKEVFPESLPLNQAAGLAAACLDGAGQADDSSILHALTFARNAIATHNQFRDLNQIVGILYLMRAKLQADGESRESTIEKALQQIRFARRLLLSPEKALIAVHLLPEVKDLEPLLSIQKQNPNLAADREVQIPVRSPSTGKYHFLRITLP